MEKRKKKKRVMSILGKVYVVLLFLFIYAPVFVMIAFSFSVVGIYNKILCETV